MTRVSIALPLAALVALAAVGCAAVSAPDDGRLTIATSTDVYGNIAAAVTGDLATITSIIDRPAQDPHSYEATAQDRLAVARADVVVMNGGGYDPFMVPLVSTIDPARVIIAADGAAADDHSHGGSDPHESAEDGHANEHVWYDLHQMERLVDTLVAVLIDVDPDHAPQYEQNAHEFLTELDALHQRTLELADRFHGLGAVITEPAPEPLLDALGLVNLTPVAFTHAVESGIDVAAAALFDVLEVIRRGEVRVVVWNAQTTGPEIERVVAAAHDAEIPVVEVTETLPAGTDYLAWMTAIVDDLETALTQ